MPWYHGGMDGDGGGGEITLLCCAIGADESVLSYTVQSDSVSSRGNNHCQLVSNCREIDAIQTIHSTSYFVLRKFVSTCYQGFEGNEQQWRQFVCTATYLTQPLSMDEAEMLASSVMNR